MTEPLIDRDEIASALWETSVGRPAPRALAAAADRVMAYLREVLTPEALIPVELVPHGDYVVKLPATAEDLHHRIFGEDK